MAQPMTMQEFGQTIKAKHPEYGDMADEDLGRKVLAKYPQYQDMIVPDVPKAPQVEMKKLGALDAGGGWNPDDLWRGAASGIKNMFAHPFQTAESMGQPFVASGAAPGGMYPTTAATGRPQDSQANAAVQNQAQGDQAQAAKFIGQNPAYTAGTVAGPALATAGLSKVLKVGAPVLGEAMQRGGAGVMNRTVGTYASDFDRGANPGRSYLDAGNGPSLSMQSIANKAAKSQEATGAKLASVYSDATNQGVKIPVDTVRSAINPPADNVRSVVTGPGGTGDTGPIDQFQASFNPPMDVASANGGFTPTDLWGVKKNVAQNTNWSDPTQVGMKQLRQQTTGALGSTLTDSVPEAKPLNSQYQGLYNMADRADMRANTGSSSLGHIATRGVIGAGAGALGLTHSPLAGAGLALGGMALDSVPVKTSLASALYYGGKGTVAVGNGIKGLYAPPIIPPKRQ